MTPAEMLFYIERRLEIWRHLWAAGAVTHEHILNALLNVTEWPVPSFEVLEGEIYAGKD
jgi:hypothetical protein